MVSEFAGFIRLFIFCEVFPSRIRLNSVTLDGQPKKERDIFKYEKSKLGQRHIVFALVMTPAGTAFVHFRGQCGGGPGGRRGADCCLVYNLRGFSCLRSLAGLGG